MRAERELPLDGRRGGHAPRATAATALAALRADPDVVWAEPNLPRRIAAEPLGGLLWGLQNTGQSVWWRRGGADADIDAPEAWAIARGAGVTVAVVDTGLDTGHPDLARRLVGGYDFVDDDVDTEDAHGHGTHVAGTIAAGENGVGVVGVAPDATVMPLRVLNDFRRAATPADVAAAFAYAAEHGVRVVNASLGSRYPSQAERARDPRAPRHALRRRGRQRRPDGIGDDNDDATREYPCAYEEPNVVCVGATDASDAAHGVLQLRRHERRPVRARAWASSPRIPRRRLRRPLFGTGDGRDHARHVAGAAAPALAAARGLDAARR